MNMYNLIQTPYQGFVMAYRIFMPILYFQPSLIFGLYFLLNNNLDRNYRNSVVHLVFCASLFFSLVHFITNGLDSFLYTPLVFVVLQYATLLAQIIVCILGYNRETFKIAITSNRYQFIKYFSLYMMFQATMNLVNKLSMMLMFTEFFGRVFDAFIMVDLIAAIMMLVAFLTVTIFKSEQLNKFFSSVYLIIVYQGYLIYDIARYIKYKSKPMFNTVLDNVTTTEPLRFEFYFRYSDAHLDLFFVGLVALIVLFKVIKSTSISNDLI